MKKWPARKTPKSLSNPPSGQKPNGAGHKHAQKRELACHGETHKFTV